ncbi:MAG: hypothetical protein AB8G95_15015 [Anaerolineae bacterium]
MNSFSEILRPSLAKMNLAIMLFVIVGYLVWPMLSALFGGDNIMLGFPMPIRQITLSTDGIVPTERFNVPNIAIDFCFWYVIGAIYLWYKFKRDQSLKDE